MPTPLEIARSENRNFLLFSDEDLIDKLYDQYQDRYPNKQLFTEFLTTDVDQFDMSKLTPVSPNIPQTETEVDPEPQKPSALSTVGDFGADLITKAIPAGFLQATGSGLKYGAAVEKLPDYLSGVTSQVTEQYKAAKRVLANQDNFELSLVERAKEIVDLYENEYSARNSEFFRAGEELQEFAQKKFPQDERWKDNAIIVYDNDDFAESQGKISEAKAAGWNVVEWGDKLPEKYKDITDMVADKWTTEEIIDKILECAIR